MNDFLIELRFMWMSAGWWEYVLTALGYLFYAVLYVRSTFRRWKIYNNPHTGYDLEGSLILSIIVALSWPLFGLVEWVIFPIGRVVRWILMWAFIPREIQENMRI